MGSLAIPLQSNPKEAPRSTVTTRLSLTSSCIDVSTEAQGSRSRMSPTFPNAPSWHAPREEMEWKSPRTESKAQLPTCPSLGVTPLGGSTTCSSADLGECVTCPPPPREAAPRGPPEGALGPDAAKPSPCCLHLLYMFQKSCRLAWFTTLPICCR